MQVFADFMQILTSRLDFYSKNLVFYYQCARKCGQTRTNSKSGNLKSKFLRLFWRLCKFLIMCILEISFLTTISLNWISFVARPWWFFIKNAKFRSQNGFLSVWVILMYKRSSKIEFWNKIGSERQVIFKSILNSCACLP